MVMACGTDVPNRLMLWLELKACICMKSPIMFGHADC